MLFRVAAVVGVCHSFEALLPVDKCDSDQVDSEVADTNGGLTTTAGSVFFRTSTCSLGSRLAQLDGNVCGRDSRLQRWGEAAARYLTDLDAPVQYGHAVPRNRALDRQTDQLGLGPGRADRCDRLGTDVARLGCGTTHPRPAEIGSTVRSMSLP